MSRLDFEHDVRALEMALLRAASIADLRFIWEAAETPVKRDHRCIAAKDTRKTKLMQAAE